MQCNVPSMHMHGEIMQWYGYKCFILDSCEQTIVSVSSKDQTICYREHMI